MDPNLATARLEQRRRRRRQALAGLLLTLSLGTIGAGVFTMAYFSDTDTSTGSFTAGSIVLNLGSATVYNVANMFPGDVQNATLTLTNAGSGQLRYSMTTALTSGSAPLAAQLTAVVKTKGTSCAAFDGTQLFSGALSSAAFGNPLVTGDVGDPTLNPGSTDLCFRVTMPSATGNTFQGLSAGVTFTFNSEQTANNP